MPDREITPHPNPLPGVPGRGRSENDSSLRSRMAVEIEAKMAVEDLSQVRAKLTELNAQRIGQFFETNTFFDNEDRSLLAADKGLRLRLKRNIATGDEDHIITFKGPRQHGALKSREEV